MELAFLFNQEGIRPEGLDGETGLLHQVSCLGRLGHRVAVVVAGRSPDGLLPSPGQGLEQIDFHRVAQLNCARVVAVLESSDAAVATDLSQLPVLLRTGGAAPFLLFTGKNPVREYAEDPQNNDETEAGYALMEVGAAVKAGLTILAVSEEATHALAGRFGITSVWVGNGERLDIQRLEKALWEGVERFRGLTARQPRISLCVIARNEEDAIGKCLRSARSAVDEMVVVDTGSDDRTRQVAAECGATVFSHRWQGDFAAARNVALEHVTGDWVLVLDADEVLAPGSGEVIRRAVRSPHLDGFRLDIVNLLGEDRVGGAVTSTNIRLFRRDGFRYEGAIHEQIGPSIVRRGGKVGALAGARILHDGYLASTVEMREKKERNLSILRQQAEENPQDPFVHYNLGVEYMRLNEVPRAVKSFQRSYRLLPGLNVSYAPLLIRHLAVCLLSEGRAGEAVSVLETASEAYPSHTDLFYLRGLAYNRLGEYDRALEQFEECLRLGDGDGVFGSQAGAGSFLACLGMAESYLGLGLMEKAMECRRQGEEEAAVWCKSLGLVSRATDGTWAELTAAESLVSEGRLEEALAWYRGLQQKSLPRDLSPALRLFLLQRKLTLELVAGDPAQATGDAEAVTAVDVQTAVVCRALIDWWFAPAGIRGNGKWPEGMRWRHISAVVGALLDFRQTERWAALVKSLGQALDPTELRLGLGKMLFGRGLYEGAAEYLLACAAEGKADADAWWQLGEIARQQSDTARQEAGRAAQQAMLADALNFYRQAIRLAPERARFWVSAALCYQAQGRERAGLRLLKLAMRRTGGEILHITRMALELSARVRSDCAPASGLPLCGRASSLQANQPDVSEQVGTGR
ncbi:MAG TPA: glycosyltransferase [Firmicutes bacterium]|nr:glycosyltransferase [Bacillota bacterium]